MLRVILCGAATEGFTAALADTEYTLTQDLSALRGERILFALPLEAHGVNHAAYDLLHHLRTHPGCMAGSVGGVWIHGEGDLYTKSLGRDIVLAASLAGCAFPGRCLVEGTGHLRNFAVQAKNGGCSLEEAYRRAVQFYFPGADIRVQMSVNLCASVEKQPEPKPVLLDLFDLMGV